MGLGTLLSGFMKSWSEIHFFGQILHFFAIFCYADRTQVMLRCFLISKKLISEQRRDRRRHGRMIF